ncbi:MAG: alpha/beta fold hydrolase [Gammaproteobacteria bacterium]|nr:MAG: alpha/beta fold hydrolase [Gammaproteobacteria bacterium]
MSNLEVLHHIPSEKKFKTPLLFVHGAYVGAWCWEEKFLPYFADLGFEVYAVSLRGHGKSWGRMFVHSYGIREYVSDVEKVIEHEIKDHVALIGHSMGAAVVQQYLRKHDHQALCEAAVFLAPLPYHGVGPASMEIAMRDPMIMMQIQLVQMFGSSFATPDFARKSLFTSDTPMEDLIRYRPLFQPESFNTIWDVIFADMPTVEDLKDIPLHFVAGEKDMIFSVDSIAKSAHKLECGTTRLPNSSHMLMLDPYWREAADELYNWLKVSIK